VNLQCEAPGPFELLEEMPEGYKHETPVADVYHRAGSAKKVARMAPAGVIKE
jgi:RNA-splicing ligase RtcB